LHNFAPASGMIADMEDMCTDLLAPREDSAVWHLSTLCYQKQKANCNWERWHNLWELQFDLPS